MASSLDTQYIVCDGTCMLVLPGRMSSTDLSGLVQMQSLWLQAQIFSYCQREDGKEESKVEHEARWSSVSVDGRSRHALSELLRRVLRLQELTPMISISKGFLRKQQNGHFPL